MSQADRLAAMANQIAGFWRTQAGDQAGAVADHLVKFWTPPMCDILRTHVQAGGMVDPLVQKAVDRLPKPAVT